jgi:hypothetical protein
MKAFLDNFYNIDGSPHAITWTHAGQVNAALLDFLRH